MSSDMTEAGFEYSSVKDAEKAFRWLRLNTMHEPGIHGRTVRIMVWKGLTFTDLEAMKKRISEETGIS